jgi:hypothetical protein
MIVIQACGVYVRVNGERWSVKISVSAVLLCITHAEAMQKFMKATKGADVHVAANARHS